MSITNQAKHLTLPNGMQIHYLQAPEGTIAAQLITHTGWLHEQPGEEGLAHFLEHILMTGGTQEIPPERLDELSRNFGYSNATTSKEKTAFDGSFLPEDLQDWLHFAQQITLHPAPRQERIEQERQRVLREMGDNKSKPGRAAYQAVHGFVFGPNSPHNKFGLGKEETIQGLTIEQILAFHQKNYNPTNMVLYLAGDLPPNIDAMISQHFGNEPAGPSRKIVLPRNPRLSGNKYFHFSAPELLNTDKPEDSSAQLILACDAPTATEADHAAYRVLAFALGSGGMLLHDRLSAKKGLCYGVNIDYSPSDNIGGAAISTPIAATRIEEAIDTLFTELGVIRNQQLSAEDLKALQRKIRYSFAERTAGAQGHLNALRHLVEGQRTVEGYSAALQAVTATEIQHTARTYLPENRATSNYALLVRNPLLKNSPL